MEFIISYFTSLASQLIKMPYTVFTGLFHDKYYEISGKGGPVIMMVGFTGGAPRKSYVEYFKSRNIEFYMLDFGLQTKSIDFYQRELSKFIEDKNLKNPTLVGISMGALISIKHAQKNNWKNINKIIAVATPFWGSSKAYFTIFAASGRQMLIGSKYLKNIREAGLKKNKVITINAKWDALVWNNHLRIPNTINEEIDAGGHDKIHKLKYLKPVFDKYIK